MLVYEQFQLKRYFYVMIHLWYDSKQISEHIRTVKNSVPTISKFLKKNE